MSTGTVGAGELFAISQGKKCVGSQKCYWCGAACDKSWPHSDHKPLPFSKYKSGAKHSAGLYVCVGCWLYRRASCTVYWMGGGYGDKQDMRLMSWWMTDEGLRGIRKEDSEKVWQILLAPPPLFCLSFIEGEVNVDNRLHMALVNDLQQVNADTPLLFTVNNVPHQFTVYEVRECCKHGPDGKSPGVHALVRVLGSYRLPEEPGVENRKGRPPKNEDDSIRRVVSKK